MSRQLLSRCLGLSVTLALVGLSGPARSYDSGERCDLWEKNVGGAACMGIVESKLQRLSIEDAPAVQSSAAVADAAIFKLANFGAGTETGEPTLAGKMKRTVWGHVYLPQSRRIVIHTFGSDFDTVLAVYTGSAVNALTLVTSNDNRAVVGLGTTHSLVQFNAIAGKDYSIQVGSKTGAEGEIFAGVFVFPPTGGLSAFMATVGGSAWNGRDYVCNNANVAACGNPNFILHNSTNRTLTVTGSSSLGAGVTAPAGGVFWVSAVNHNATTSLRALAIYVRPFNECCVAPKQFKVTICQMASANGACLAPASESLTYTATKNATKFFKVFVKPPTTNPGFDPTKRRVFFKLWQDQPTSGSFDAVVGAESIAVRKN